MNIGYAIWDRGGNFLAGGGLDSLTGHDFWGLTDPQVIWDWTTQRFYYVVVDRINNNVAWGFSKTDSPSSNFGEWCRYTSDFGYSGVFPDYPKLGDSADFLLIGINAFRNNGTTLSKFVGGDLAWIAKPSSGPLTTCPATNEFNTGRFAKLKNADGSLAFTPSPADLVDSSPSGYVVSAADAAYSKKTNFLTIREVTKGPGGLAVLSAPRNLPVSTFAVPASAPQAGTKEVLDTLDGRLEHAVAAFDPRFGRTTVWTAHAVFGGAGSEERWYEIDPATTPALLQSGAASSPSQYVFNGAISPDRAVSSAGSGFGSNMVLGFNTSSAQEFPAIRMVSKIGSNPQSRLVLITQSPGPYDSFGCHPELACRWGDYSGATPDPVAPLGGSTGKVWLTNEWNFDLPSPNAVEWRTWNWAATP
ncbi:MAG: hypothetical protein WAT66_12955 [Actinomycetota bacterium]